MVLYAWHIIFDFKRKPLNNYEIDAPGFEDKMFIGLVAEALLLLLLIFSESHRILTFFF